MFLAQEFKTLAGAQKRAAFENAHCVGRYRYSVVKARDGECPDSLPFNPSIFKGYTWRLERKVRAG